MAGQRVLLDQLITLPDGTHGALEVNATGGLAEYIAEPRILDANIAHVLC